MKNPLVSIVIPIFNNEKTILDAIKSVYLQTYKNWELILINDGSTDSTLSIINKINDRRVTIINDNQNKGLVYRLNQSTLLVRGDLIARMDGDDLMHPERIQKQVSLFELNDNLDLVDTGAYSIDQNGKPLGIRGVGAIKTDELFVLKNAMLLHASIVGKKLWFQKNRYDSRFIRAEDRELWMRTFKFTNVARVQEPLYIVREGKVNINNYITSLKTVKLIYNIYGIQILSNFNFKLELFKSNLKIILIRLLGILNIHDIVTKMRNKSLNIDEIAKVNKLIKEIKSFNLENLV